MLIYQSPNYNYRPQGTAISMVVIHATANSTLEGLTSWFMNPESRVSAHYGIGKDGQIARYVEEYLRAWHAGSSYWKGRDDCNDFSIGIELVNLNDGYDPYPQEQANACIGLVTDIVSRYRSTILIHDIVAHYDISPGRKTDPKGFDMESLRYIVDTNLRG